MIFLSSSHKYGLILSNSETEIEVLLVTFPIINESYTSKCSFYDSEEIGYHNKYLGERIKRGLYETKEKRIVNADINGALNILKKSKIDNYQLIDNLRNRGITLPKRVPSKVILGESTVF